MRSDAVLTVVQWIVPGNSLCLQETWYLKQVNLKSVLLKCHNNSCICRKRATKSGSSRFVGVVSRSAIETTGLVIRNCVLLSADVEHERLSGEA